MFESAEIDFDLGGALGKVGDFVTGIAGTVGTIYAAKTALTAAKERNAIDLQKATLANSLALTQAAGAVEINKAKIGAEVAKANREAQLYSFLPSTSGGGLSLTMVALIAVGVFAAVKFAK